MIPLTTVNSFIDFCDEMMIAEEGFITGTYQNTGIASTIRAVLKEISSRIEEMMLEMNGYYVYTDAFYLMDILFENFQDILHIMDAEFNEIRRLSKKCKTKTITDADIKEFKKAYIDIDTKSWKQCEAITEECHKAMTDFKKKIEASKKSDVTRDIVPFRSAAFLHKRMKSIIKAIKFHIGTFEECLDNMKKFFPEEIIDVVSQYLTKSHQRLSKLVSMCEQSLSYVKAKPIDDSKKEKKEEKAE